MKRLVAVTVFLAFVMVTLSGCAELQQAIRENPKAVLGAAAGAAGGLLIGGLAFNSTTAALAGGLIGALGGGILGSIFERRERGYAETTKEYSYDPQQGTRVKVESVWVNPRQVRPGQTVNILVTYALLHPDPAQTIGVTERREITFDGQLVGDPVLHIKRRAGTWSSAVQITLPKDARPGTYQTLVTVRAGSGQGASTTTFNVRL
ncbi:MAG: glycine zipper domain-containing protein [Candidatus Methylomirabilia bacterium]